MTLKPPGPYMEAHARVKAIAEQATGITINPDTHPKHYCRSGRELIRSAASYQEDGQSEFAYTLYLRFLTIFLEKLLKHPNYKEVPLSERKLMSDYCKKIIPQAEYLKKELLEKYEKEHEEYLKQVERLKAQAEESRQKELEEQRKRQTGKEAKGDNAVAASKYDPHSNFNNSHSQYGNLIHPTGFGIATGQPSAPLPDVYFYDDTTSKAASLKPESNPTPPVPSSSAGPSSMPSVDRSTKPNRVLTPIYSGTRPLIVPVNLTDTFLRHATTNTNKNVETCGLLTGRIRGSQLIITDLIIPKQTGSSDTCNMLNETDIFDLQDKYNLITFGWIHTHPSQTAFLSSIDMHTHYCYQVMMPEAIAIVCAPKHNQIGTFTLTQQGMEEIGRCNLAGFHPHASTGIFTEASHYKLEGTEVKVHDLR